MLPLLPLLIALAAAPRGGVASSSRVLDEPFAAAAAAPSDVDMYLHVANAAAAREIVADHPFGAALESLVADLAVGDAWRSFVQDIAASEASADHHDEGAIFDLLFGEELTLLARGTADGGDALEWAVLSKVSGVQGSPGSPGSRAVKTNRRHPASELLEVLSPRISLGGWRTLVGHDLSFLVDGDLMVVAPAERRGLAESVIDLRRRGGPRLAGLEVMESARALEPNRHDGTRVELLVRHPGPAESGDGWTAAVIALRPDGTVAFRHRSTFEQPQFNPVPRRSVDLAALRSLGGQASMVVIQPLVLEGALGEVDGSRFVALSPDAAGSPADPGWSRALLEQFARLDSVRNDPLSPWLRTAGAPRLVLDRASMRSAIDEWARSAAVRSILSVPAMMVSWKPAETSERPAETAHLGGEPAASDGRGAAGSAFMAGGAQSAILFEIGRGEAAVADQQRALAADARRHLGGAQARPRPLPGEFPGGGGLLVQRSRGELANPQITRVVRTSDGDFQLVGSDPALIESLARQIVGSTEQHTQPDRDRGPLALRSAGFMHGEALAVELASLLGGSPAGDLASLAAGLDEIEWRILQPDTHTIEIEAAARLAPKTPSR